MGIARVRRLPNVRTRLVGRLTRAVDGMFGPGQQPFPGRDVTDGRDRGGQHGQPEQLAIADVGRTAADAEHDDQVDGGDQDGEAGDGDELHERPGQPTVPSGRISPAIMPSGSSDRAGRRRRRRPERASRRAGAARPAASASPAARTVPGPIHCSRSRSRPAAARYCSRTAAASWPAQPPRPRRRRGDTDGPSWTPSTSPAATAAA